MAEKGKWAGFLKYGCFGCLGLVAVGLVFGAVMVGLALIANSKEQRFEPIEPRRFRRRSTARSASASAWR